MRLIFIDQLLLFLILSSSLIWPLSIAVASSTTDHPEERQTQAILNWISKLLCDASFTCTDIARTPSNFAHQQQQQFHQDGYTVLENFFSGEEYKLLANDWFHFSIQHWNEIFRVLHEKGEISEPRHVMNEEYMNGKLRQPGYQEIVHRYPGRYELSLPTIISDENNEEDDRFSLYQKMPSLQPIINQLEPLVISILKQHPNYKEEDQRKYNLLQSMVISAPGSHSQKFHVDTTHLHNDTHWPAHVMNVFIPLVNITDPDFGPTELIPQSHFETRLLYNPERRHLAKTSMYEMETPVAPLMNVGDVLLFDFRLLHRGLANELTANRPLLVLVFSIPSFHDTANWPGPSIFHNNLGYT